MRDVLIVGTGELGRTSARALIDSMAFKNTVDIPINETYPKYITSADDECEIKVEDRPYRYTCYSWRQCRKMNKRDKAWDAYTWFITAYKNSPTEKLKQKAVKEFKRKIRHSRCGYFTTNRMHEWIATAQE